MRDHNVKVQWRRVKKGFHDNAHSADLIVCMVSAYIFGGKSKIIGGVWTLRTPIFGMYAEGGPSLHVE